jgi:S1-C subfamily serine protease
MITPAPALAGRPGAATAAVPGATAAAATRPGRWQRVKQALRRRIERLGPRLPWILLMLVTLLLGLSMGYSLRPMPRPLTQKVLDLAVLKTLETVALPSPAKRAAEAIAPSLVRVVGMMAAGNRMDEDERGVGSGVVITDKGVILTNLHVVLGSDKIKVIFADGSESEAFMVSAEPKDDLAVLQARKIPDDLIPATMRSTSDLAPGDEVVAVGFPFGIGPSTSAGVVSGLKRSFMSPEGKRELTNLIQFDAAANPGNSGGPLVTMDGEVVGIVTAILNPTQQRTFIGIGFAVPIENAAGAVGLHPF